MKDAERMVEQESRVAAEAARSASEWSAFLHLIFVATGVGAAVLRIISYTGPPRPVRAVVLDGVVMLIVAFGVAELILAVANSLHAAIGCGLLSGLIGWEMLKRFLVRWAETRASKP